MAAPEESAGEGVVAQGPAAPRGAALLPQLLQNRPPPAAEGRRVVAIEEGQSGAAPPGREAVSEPVSSAFLLRQPTPASSSPAVGFSSAPQENGLLAPPAPGSSARPFASETQLVPSTPQNASQQLQDAARRVALQQGRSEAAATAVPPPARLLPPKQLDTICVQLQPDQTKENERPAFATIATIQSQNVTTTQPVEKNAKVLGVNVVNPQVIRIEPLTGTGSHQFFLHNSSGPTIQLLLQRPHRQVSADKIMTQQILNEQRSKSPMQTPRGIVVSTNPANSIGNCEKKHREQKLKKTLKVKTRSGRISRPPKYKAKDYKFIKTEDLADCHQSDSDDYSELSVEEDEEGKDKGMPLFGPLAYDLRPKLFKCQTCEKSYIGKGGLARHYKLNPDHGPQESSPPPPMNSLCRIALLEDAGKANGESNLRTFVPPQVTVTNEKADATENGQQGDLDNQGGMAAPGILQDQDILVADLNTRYLQNITVYLKRKLG
uniref:Uncharacterized protein n=1 Tax=Sphaerodactylus townsendi TaxID=933632 RepID=A0ACB8G646_9SAUR